MTTIDDGTAIRLLQTIAEARLRPGTPDLAPSPDVRAALAAAFGDAPAAGSSEGDLARAALALLAEDPAYAGPIEIMARQPATGADRYIEPTTIALTTAALLVLQTRIKFRRDHTGKWSFEIEKKAASDGAVKLVVQHLLALLK
jgi:hypothetical protein